MSLFFKGRGLSGGLCYHRVVSNVNGYAGLQTAGFIAHETGHKWVSVLKTLVLLLFLGDQTNMLNLFEANRGTVITIKLYPYEEL